MEYPTARDCLHQDPTWEPVLRRLHRLHLIDVISPRTHAPNRDRGEPRRPPQGTAPPFEGEVRWSPAAELLVPYFCGHVRERREQILAAQPRDTTRSRKNHERPTESFMAKTLDWWHKVGNAKDGGGADRYDFGPLKNSGTYSRRESGGPGHPAIQPTDLIQISDCFDSKHALIRSDLRPATSVLVEFERLVRALLGEATAPDPDLDKGLDSLRAAMGAAIAARHELGRLAAIEHPAPEPTGRDRLHRDLFRFIAKQLRSPYVFGEERQLQGKLKGLKRELRRCDEGVVWIVDALDGARMFWHRFPNWCISVGAALWHAKTRTLRPLCGVVYNPPNDELFIGLAAGGALLIRPERRKIEPLEPSGQDDPRTAMIATHLSTDTANAGRTEAFLRQALWPLTKGCNRVVMLGCGQLALCYVASGRLDGFLNDSTNPWNVYAGRVILKAVRNAYPRMPIVTDFAGKPWRLGCPSVLAACSKPIGDFLLDIAAILPSP